MNILGDFGEDAFGRDGHASESKEILHIVNTLFTSEIGIFPLKNNCPYCGRSLSSQTYHK